MADLTAAEKRELVDEVGRDAARLLNAQVTEMNVVIGLAQAKADDAHTDAGTGIANAATADGKAVTAQSRADDAHGDAATGIANAATAQSRADDAHGDAATALANAATADGKAVTADGKAVTADGKAVTADGKAVTADGKAVAAQGTADTALANAATADGKAVTADGKAVTADGKAVAAQGDASTALANAATALTAAGKMAVGTPVNAVAASGAIALNDAPHDGDTVTVGATVYRFKTTIAQLYDVLIEVSAADNAANLSAAINAGAGAGTKYYTATPAHPNVSATVLDDDVTVTAKVKGVAGNAIALAEAAEHVTLSGAVLTGGVDGTVGVVDTHFHDNSYVYVAIATNTIADANWRRAAISAY